MKLQFLCDGHRLELSNKPAKAIHCWQNGFDTGQLLFDQDMWQEAIPHFGCAFEAAEIMITTSALPPQRAYELFSSSAISLALTFEKLGNKRLSADIYWLAINRLERELSYPLEDTTSINHYLHSLYQHLKGVEFPIAESRYRSTPKLSGQQVAIH